MLGRPLKPQEVVHHKDRDKRNNNQDNLLVFVDNSNHTRFHHTGIYAPTDEENVVYAPKQYIDACAMCGAPLRQANKHNQCWNCWSVSQRKVQRPDAETLAHAVANNSMVAVGKMYGVSDNAIRKWCKSYGIDWRKKAT